MPPEPTVFVVDDDDAVRDGLRMLFESAGLEVKTYASSDQFLDSYTPGHPGCLLLDLRMPGLGGLELQERLTERDVHIPIIILTGHGDVPAAVRALRGGAMDFIEKPCNGDVLLARVLEALERDAALRRESSLQAVVAERLQRLTPREREIMDRIVAGSANKVVAIELGISERTVELHRSRIMHKMEVRSLPELMRMVLSPEGTENSRG